MISRFQAGGFTVSGYSSAGIATTIAIRELGYVFDIGFFAPELLRGDRLFLSHAHPDHCGALLSWLGGRRLLSMKCADIFLPPSMARPTLEIVRACEKMQEFKFDFRLFELHPGHEVPLGRDLHVQAFPLQHKLETFAYLIKRRVLKLREEFSGLSGRELCALKEAGREDELFRQEWRPVLSYVPDTLPEGLDALPDNVLAADLVLVECTFLDGRKSMDAVKAGAHIHLDDLLPRFDRFTGKQTVLFHISRLYKKGEAEKLLRARLPEALQDRVMAFPSAGDAAVLDDLDQAGD